MLVKRIRDSPQYWERPILERSLFAEIRYRDVESDLPLKGDTFIASPTVLVAVKRPGEKLALERFPSESNAWSAKLDSLLGEVRTVMTLRSYYGDLGLRFVSAFINDDALENSLPISSPHPGHPELFIRGAVLYAAVEEFQDLETGEMTGRRMDLSDDDIAVVEEMLG